MNTRQMEVFVNIVRFGNFSNAAKKMYLSQPAVSSNIDMLEKELDAKLFIRQGRRASLTEKGKIFYEHCLKVMALTEEILEKIGNDTAITGTISIISSFVPGLYLLPCYISEFSRLNKGIKYTANVKNSRDAYEGVLNHLYDIGLSGAVPKNDALVQKRIFTDEMVLITPKTAPYIDLPQIIDFPLVKDAPFIMRSWGSDTLAITEKTLTKSGITVNDLNILAEYDSGEAVVQSVASGMGVSIISKICVKDNPNVLSFNLKGIEMKRDFYAFIQNNEFIPPRIQQFFEFLPEV